MRKNQRFLIIFIITILPILVLFFSCENLFPNEEYKPSGSSFSLKPGVELLDIRSSDTIPSGLFSSQRLRERRI